MKSEPIEPARIAIDADGRPRSIEFDDIYFPRQGALAQARHVFLAGNGLPLRWRGRSDFVILETGFGYGNNFLAAWAAWRDDAQRPERLHFVSIEAHPPTAADLAASPRDPELADLGRQLDAAWPPATCNLHLLDFERGAVRLSLAFGHAAAWLPQITASVDAFFLDGFAPARNPSMWEARLFKAMARLAVPGATMATWTASSSVRAGLQSAGFTVQEAAGSGGKRDITLARFAPRFVPRRSPRAGTGLVAPTGADEPVVVVGAGLAGCAVAAALARQGRRTIVVERHLQIASEGSGNDTALFHGVVHADDGRHARFYRAAALLAQRVIAAAIADQGVAGSTAGLLRLEPDAGSCDALQAVIDGLRLPSDYVRAVDAGAASDLCGVGLRAPAWFFPRGGWVAPRQLAAALLAWAGSRCELKTGIEITAIRRDGDWWTLHDAASHVVLQGRDVVLADAGAALVPEMQPAWPITGQEAQLSSLAASDWAGTRPRLPVAGSGTLSVGPEGRAWFGASPPATSLQGSAAALDPAAHRRNVERLHAMLAGPLPFSIGAGDAFAVLGGRRAWRWSASDRLPVIGAVPFPSGRSDARARIDQPRLVARHPGLHVCLALGSRGVTSALLGAEIIASNVTGAPAPVEVDLLDAVDPARFASRQARRAERQPPVGPIAGSTAT